MNTDERILQLEKAVESQHSTIKKLTSRELALRAFALAVFAQPSIDLEALHRFYLEHLDGAAGQIPPNLQDAEALDSLRISMEEHIAVRRHGKPQ